MSSRPFLLAAALFAATTFRPALAQDPSDGPALVRELMASYAGHDVPGAVVGVFRGGELTWVEAYGEASLEWDAANTPGTIFNIASVSKQFTAFAVALLESRGRLSIDDEIHVYLPELPDFGAPITIRHLLTHTSGLRSLHALLAAAGWSDEDRRTNEDLFRLMLRQKDLNFEPGTEYLYCNTGYLLAAMIVERVSGERFVDWMKANVFEPLGMNDTSVQDDYRRVYRNTASSYNGNRERGFAPATPYWAYYGSGNIHTTAADLARWGHGLATGALGGRAVVERMAERGVLAGSDTLDYALGVNVGWLAGHRYFEHGGSIGGYRSRLVVFPELDAGVVMLSNNGSFSSAGAFRIARAFFEELGPEPPAGEREARTADPPRPTWTPAPDEVARYAGRYRSEELATTYEILLRDGGLVAWHARLGEASLLPFEPGRFDAPGLQIRFGIRDGRPGFFLSNGRARHLWFLRE